MVSTNKSLKLKEVDETPLLENSDEKVAFSNNPIDDSEDDEDREKPFKQHDITLWLSDAVVLLIEHFQYYAILLSLSEHWGWPIGWINATAFTFIFNFDIWEFRKVETGAFDHSRTSFISTTTIGFNYASYLAAWAVILIIIGLVFAGIYFRWMKRRPLYLLLYIARWKRVMFLTMQFLAMPFGVAAARVFHCRLDETTLKDVMDVQNEHACFSGVHIAFMSLVVIIFFFMFVLYPIILTKWVKDQVFSNDASRHEGYLQLKEAEYEQGLDLLWDMSQYHLFSSYKRFWVYYNPLKFFFKLCIIVAFAFSLKSTFWSAAGMTIIFSLATISLVIRLPYRVRCFNVMIICSHFTIAANALIGNFMVRPPWENPEAFQIVAFLRQPTINRILTAINLTWVIIVGLWILYLFLLNSGLLGKERIWPRLSYDTSNFIGEDTKKYLKAALKARHALKYALAAIPLFAPVHELSHEIKVINAYCREAECIGDPTHDTLWDLLDELIEAHNSLARVSVFSTSGKNSIRETSEEFIKLMPSFKKRLKQREYDFILMTPVKRRILLKMYILSVFVSNKRKHVSPEEEASTKLQTALLEFEGRSLNSDYDTSGFFSASPSIISGEVGSRNSWSKRPHSTSRPTTSETQQSKNESDINGFLNDVDKFTSLYPVDGNDSGKEKQMSTDSKKSKTLKSRDGLLSRQSKEAIKSNRSSKSGSSVSLPITEDSSSSSSVLQEIDRSMIQSSSNSEAVLRPLSAPLSPNRYRPSLVTPFRPGTSPQGTVSFKPNRSLFDSTNDIDLISDTLYNTFDFENTPTKILTKPLIHDKERATSPIFLTTSIQKQRPGTAPLSLVQLMPTSRRLNTAPTSSLRQSPVASRLESAHLTERNFSNGSPESILFTEMSSTLSLPRQVEESEGVETKCATTEL